MAKQAMTTRDIESRAARKARKQVRKDAEERVKAVGSKSFASMSRPDKDELLFLLCLKAGILPEETE